MSAAFDDQAETLNSADIGIEEERATILEVLERAHTEAQIADEPQRHLFRANRFRRPLGQRVLRNALRREYAASGDSRKFIVWLKSLDWKAILQILVQLAPLVL